MHVYMYIWISHKCEFGKKGSFRINEICRGSVLVWWAKVLHAVLVNISHAKPKGSICLPYNYKQILPFAFAEQICHPYFQSQSIL